MRGRGVVSLGIFEASGRTQRQSGPGRLAGTRCRPWSSGAPRPRQWRLYPGGGRGRGMPPACAWAWRTRATRRRSLCGGARAGWWQQRSRRREVKGAPMELLPVAAPAGGKNARGFSTPAQAACVSHWWCARC